MKTHFWAGDFTPTRIRKTVCGRNFLRDLDECIEFNEFMDLSTDQICLSCFKGLIRAFEVAK